MEFATITGREISTNKDSDKKTLLLQVRASDDDDIQTVEFHNADGEDSRPVNGSRVFYIDITPSFSIGFAIDDNIEPADDLEDGEKEIYSQEDGARAATIRWKKDGTLVFNGGTESALRGDSFKSWADNHTHPAPGGPTSPPTTPSPESTLNDTVKL